MESILKHAYKLNKNAEVVFETPNDGFSYFFGYYDKSPLDINNKYLLSHKVSFDGRDIKKDDKADVGYWDIKKNEFIKIGETNAFNWQQGSQLQWLPPDYKNKVIYNDRRNNKFISIIYDIETKEERIIPFPVYVIHPDGNYALGVNYERLYFCRPGYNYKGIINKKWDKPYHEDDGVFKIDLQTGNIKQIVSTEDIVRINSNEHILNNNNWLEHIMFNPSGSRFLFFHRWNYNNKDYSRIFTCNTNGKKLYMFPDVKFYSHYSWKNKNELTIWTLEPHNYSVKRKLLDNLKNNNFIRNFIKPVYKSLKQFLPDNTINKITNSSKLINFKDETTDYQIIGENILEGNGHITWSNNKKYILNDTYADSNNIRHLMLYSLKNKSIINIGKFYSNYNECIFRCDLHPKFSHDNKYIIIDSSHRKKRSQIVIQTKEI